MYMHAKPLQSCTNLCHTGDCGPPGSSVHGILQARILEWVAVSSSRGSSPPRDQTYVSHLLHRQEGSLPPAPTGKHPPSVVFVFILLTGPFRESEFLISWSPIYQTLFLFIMFLLSSLSILCLVPKDFILFFFKFCTLHLNPWSTSS